MEFSRTKKLIFTRCLNRVNKAIYEEQIKNDVRIKHKDIHENESLISAFFNYNGQKNSLSQNNPYLLTQSLIGESKELTHAKKEKKIHNINTSKYVFTTGFLGTLSYFDNNLFYLLWGKEDELTLYLPMLFDCLIKDILDSSYKDKSTIKFALYDYARYAFYQTIKDLKDEHHIECLLTTFGVFDTHYAPGGSYETSLTTAITHLYKKRKVSDTFSSLFMRFAETQFSYKYIDNHIEKKLLPMLKDELFTVFIPDSESFGLRIHHLIKTDIIKVLWTSSPDGKDPSELELVRTLINITSTYITKLQEIDDKCHEINFSIYQLPSI